MATNQTKFKSFAECLRTLNGSKVRREVIGVPTIEDREALIESLKNQYEPHGYAISVNEELNIADILSDGHPTGRYMRLPVQKRVSFGTFVKRSADYYFEDADTGTKLYGTAKASESELVPGGFILSITETHRIKYTLI